MAYNAVPLLAVFLAQVDAGASSAITIYGPMGVICGWMMLRDEKRAAQADKLRESIADVAHQMKGLNRNLLYVTATSGPAGLREVAAKELERVDHG